MRNITFWWFVLALLFAIDLYVFQALKVLTSTASPRTRLIIHSIYWTLTALTVLLFVLMPYLSGMKAVKLARNSLFTLLFGLFIAKIIAVLFFLTDDLRRLAFWVFERFRGVSTNSISADAGADAISRSTFLSWAGMIAGGGLFSSLIYGLGNKYNYQVVKQKLVFPNLPKSFAGLKLVHISDIHSGSFTDKKAVEKGIQKIMHLQPDLILFTGDLVNNIADEMDDYIDVFSQLKAPMGVFSTLGNHDYGDYVPWPSEYAKTENLERLKKVHAKMGWKLLMNEHVEFKKGDDSIALLGVENWSAKARFPKHGNLKNAYENAANFPFKILMSHDPSHWKAEVIPSYSSIDLTLSGHTHGMQFGVELPGIKWSPVQYMYKEWAGLYEYANQKLYVNRGFGFLGYPGRVGVLPEITLIELNFQ